MKKFIFTVWVVFLFFSCNRYDRNMENNVYYNSTNNKQVKKLVGKIYHNYFDTYKMPHRHPLGKGDKELYDEYWGIGEVESRKLIDLYLEYVKDSIKSKLGDFIAEHPSILKSATLEQVEQILELRPTKYESYEFHVIYRGEYNNGYHSCRRPNTFRLQKNLVETFDRKNENIYQAVHSFLENYGDSLSCKSSRFSKEVYKGSLTSLNDAFFGQEKRELNFKLKNMSFPPYEEVLERIILSFENKKEIKDRVKNNL